MAERKDLGTTGLVNSMLGDDNVLVTIDGKVRQIPATALMQSLDPIRIEGLPELANSEDPRGVWLEVIDSNGEPKKMRMSTLPAESESTLAYGIQFDTSISSPTCTRIGNTELHKSLPVQSLMRGCLLDDDGKVVLYLPTGSWLGVDRSGASGQVMVEITQHYRKFVTNGTVRQVMISLYPLPGYAFVPKMYVSAYEATVQRSTLKLSSVVNATADYRGGSNNSDYDGTSKTFLGKPATAISLTNFRNYARNRKSGSAEWNCYLYEAHKTLFWLFAIEYATLNSQAAFNGELTSGGLHQGGLGDGVTNINSTKWSNFNGYYPFIPCGYTDSLGNGTGVVSYNMPTEYDSTILTTYVPRYRGIENPFGHIWKWVDGINIRISPNTENGGDGLSKVFVCTDPALFKSNGYDGYHHVGDEARTEGYVKEMIFGAEGDIIPSVVGGGSTTYYCDYHYTNIPDTEALRGVIFGGAAANGAYAGLGYANSNISPSGSDSDFGSRLCFLPK